MFKDVPHLDTVISLRSQIQISKGFYDIKETTILVHFVYMAEQFKTIENFLYFRRKSLNIHFEISRNVVWIVA